MSSKINKNLIEFIPGDTVRLNPANVALNEFYYGELSDADIYGTDTATILKLSFCQQMKEMSYCVKFDNAGDEFWFLEHELY